MKRTKKVFSVLLALVMVLAMQMTSFAAEGDITNVTINDEGSNAVFTAYKLMTATAASVDDTENSGDPDSNDRYSYTVNPKYKDIMIGIASLQNTSIETEKNLIDWLGGKDESNKPTEQDVRVFANLVYGAIQNNWNSLGLVENTDYFKSSEKTFKLPQGYYLIAEEVVGGSGEYDAVSQVMLDTAGLSNVTITTKEEVPTLDKSVKEKNDTTGEESNWQKVADYDIGDKVPFQLKATLPAADQYAAYTSYMLTFHDQMDKGLNNPTDFKVYIDSNGDGQYTDGEDTLVDASKYTVTTSGLSDECFFEVSMNAKSFASDTTKPIMVEFNATLTQEAVIGNKGNINTASLEFFNNPYGEGTGTTPQKQVSVFTFKLVTTKVDQEDAALADAGFTLYKEVPAGSVPTEYTEGDYITKGEKSYHKVGGEIQTTEDDNTLDFNGLDEGTYLLRETTTPDGYNTAEDIEFEIKPVYNLAEPPELTGLTSTNNNVILKTTTDVGSFTGEFDVKVRNTFGSELPETGGIGTTIFYIVGGILVVAAAVLLVVKKRLSHTA